MPFLNEFPEFSFVAMSLLSQKFIIYPYRDEIEEEHCARIFYFYGLY